SGPGQDDRPAGDELAERITASKGFTGLLVGIVGVIVASGLVAIPFAVAGADLDSGGFIIVGTIVQDLVMIAAAYFLTADLGRPSARTFGLRPFRSSALGWIFAALVAYLVLTSIYTVLVDPPSEQLPTGLDKADENLLLAVATGMLLVAVAPLAEEIFFRGFLYQAFRNSFGVLPGALLSAVIFGAIHLEFFKLVQLAILGVILALLFEKTKSLWPPIILHAVNNSLAFAYLLSQ
ncbi:MAG: lysostaphin resistance A-like protein, partial [Solirubrobacterales bacterium]